MFPTVILDDFFPDPDKVVDFASQQKFHPTPDGTWPGSRTDPLHVLNHNLYHFVAEKITGLFFDRFGGQYFMDMRFQKITPFCEDQHSIRNRGWIHRDKDVHFGGIIFLNKHPDEDTGTSLYKEKNGYSFDSPFYNVAKQKHYLNTDVSDEEYNKNFEDVNSQYTETVRVKNVYNRMLLFNNKEWHGVQTFGKTQDRLTISFFCLGTGGVIPPLYR